MATEDVTWRVSMASDIAKSYTKNPKVEAVFIAGSVARGWADAFSDIELNILWSVPPQDEDRMNAIRDAKGILVRMEEFAEDEWSEVYTVQGMKFEISSFLTTTIEKYIDDVITHGDTNADKQVLIAAIQAGIPRYGETCLAHYKKRISLYPERLRLNMIEENRTFEEIQYYLPLAIRHDSVMAGAIMTEVCMRLLRLLYALNRTYVSHPKFKWYALAVDEFTFCPENFVHRLQGLYFSGIQSGWNELNNLIRETLLLIQEGNE